MKTNERLAVRQVFSNCGSLQDAVDYLSLIKPPMAEVKIWGIWDAWSGRPESTAGLHPSEKDGRAEWQKEDDYLEGFRLGKQLRDEAGTGG